MKNVKKLTSLVLICALMLGSLAFSAFAADTHDHAHDEGCCELAAVKPGDSVNADICPRPGCGEQAVVYRCGGIAGSPETGTHYRLGYGNCTFSIIKCTTLRVCNACGYSQSAGTHYCMEVHACSLGTVDTCVAGR